MTLPFVCEDCGGRITLTADEALAIYQSRIALCQRCIDRIEEDAEAYRRMNEEEGRAECTFFKRNLMGAGRCMGEG